jgi:ligand-binding sensor domain-containing protein/GGDEF domain-containing protein
MINNKLRKHLLLSCLTFLLINTNLNANEMSNITFQHISTEHGLSQRTVETIYQDKYGFLWIGTQEGLNRYDGRKLDVFRHINNDSSSLSHDYIRDVIEDRGGNLWVATGGGLNRFVRKSESFEKLKFTDTKGNTIRRLNSLYIDSSEIMWIGTDGNGLFAFNTLEKDKKITPFSRFSELEKTDITVVFEDSRKRLWVGTDGNGITLISGDRQQQQIFSHDENNQKSLAHDRVRTIIEDSKGRVWVGTRGGGLSRFDELSKTFKHYQYDVTDKRSLSNNRVYKIFEDNNKQLWIATDAGLSLYNNLEDTFVRIQHSPSQQSSINHNRVLSIFQDKGDLIWVGTSAGLNIWNPITAKFVQYRHKIQEKNTLTNNHIHGFAENKAGDIYVATFGGGLNYFNPETNEFSAFSLMQGEKNSVSDELITTLMYDSLEEALWVGTVSKGVEVFNSNHQKIKSFQHDSKDISSLSNNGVTDIIKDSDGGIWVSTYRAGLNKLNDNGSFKRYRLENRVGGLANENIFQLLEDDEGYIWMITDGGGVIRLDKHTGYFTSFINDPDNESSLSGNTAWSIFQDSKSRIWIGTQGKGLNLWEPEDRRQGINKFKHYTIENGLSGSTINAIEEDSEGKLWISTNRGVDQLDTITDKIVSYDFSGLAHGNELNQAAVLRAKNGRLYFGGLDGISAFFPKEIKKNNHIPEVVLTNITSEGHSVEINEALNELTEVVFEYKDYLITFEFAALEFSQPKKNQYQYKLEGLDPDWIKLGSRNRATFTNLPAGTYTLKVKGSNNDGLWSKESINLKVVVLPAPWASWWAYSIYTALFSLLLLLVIRSQAKRLANQEMFRTLVSEQVEEKTALYVKNNDYLNEQMEQLKFHSNVDLSTGLPNQKYLSDLVKANLQWVDQYQDTNNSNCPKLCIAILHLPKIGNFSNTNVQAQLNKMIKIFNENVTSLDVNFKIVVRWGDNELGVLFYADNEAEGERFMRLIIEKLSECISNTIEHDFSQYPIKTGFVVTPFSGVKQDAIESSDLLMLTEHLLHLVINDAEINTFGIIGSNQKLNPNKFRQIMAINNLNKLKDVFIVSL